MGYQARETRKELRAAWEDMWPELLEAVAEFGSIGVERFARERALVPQVVWCLA